MQNEGQPKSNKTVILLGIVSIAIGAIPFLTTLGIIPHGPVSSDTEPLWTDWLIGLAFAGAGILVVMKGITGKIDSANDAMPAKTPLAGAVYDLLSLVIVCSLALVFTWIAFGPGPRHFSLSGGGLSIPISGFGDTVGRVAFGFGSLLFWFLFCAIAIAMMRRRRR